MNILGLLKRKNTVNILDSFGEVTQIITTPIRAVKHTNIINAQMPMWEAYLCKNVLSLEKNPLSSKYLSRGSKSTVWHYVQMSLEHWLTNLYSLACHEMFFVRTLLLPYQLCI